jgi:hypothetical protein
MKTNDLWVNGKDIYRYNGSSWVLASAYDVTQTEIDGGLITTGAISFGQTGGMAASGTVRIWAGGTGASNGQPPTAPTFRVESNGSVYSKGTFYIHDANGNIDGGFSTAGTGSIVRLWVGGSTPANGKVRVESGGYVFCSTLYAGGGTDANSSRLHESSLWIANPSSAPLMSPELIMWGTSASPPLMRMRLSENTTTPYLFSVEGRNYSSEWFHRTVIRMGWIPTRAIVQSWFSNIGADGSFGLRFDVRNGVIYGDDFKSNY